MATILLVESDEHQRLLYQEEIEREGYKLLMAGSGEEALARVTQESVDVVVLAIALPGMDGIETFRQIQDIDRHLLVVINTAYSSYKDDFMTWAAAAYVIKSADLNTLKQAVAECLQQRNIPLPESRAGEE